MASTTYALNYEQYKDQLSSSYVEFVSKVAGDKLGTVIPFIIATEGKNETKYKAYFIKKGCSNTHSLLGENLQKICTFTVGVQYPLTVDLKSNKNGYIFTPCKVLALLSQEINILPDSLISLKVALDIIANSDHDLESGDVLTCDADANGVITDWVDSVTELGLTDLQLKELATWLEKQSIPTASTISMMINDQ